MNPIKVAVILLLLLATFCCAKAGNKPGKETTDPYSTLIKSKMRLPDENNKQGTSKTICFYFTVNENGRINTVSAITSDKHLKSNLEDSFKKIELKGYPANVLSRIDIQFIVY